MTLLDSRFRALADRLIGQYGKPMLLRKVGEATYDATKGESVLDNLDYAVTGVITQPSAMLLAQGLAVSGDVLVLLAAQALQVVPEDGDILVLDNVEWKVMTVRSLYSGEQIATFECLARS